MRSWVMAFNTPAAIYNVHIYHVSSSSSYRSLAHIILSYYRQLITLPTKTNFAESSGRRQGLYHSQEMGHNDLEPYFDLSGASIYT